MLNGIVGDVFMSLTINEGPYIYKRMTVWMVRSIIRLVITRVFRVWHGPVWLNKAGWIILVV